MDLAEVEHLCEVHQPDVLYVIHYLGWPQPIQQLADLARRRGMWLVEDCALALLSDAGDTTVGHLRALVGLLSCTKRFHFLTARASWRTRATSRRSTRSTFAQAGLPSVIGRTAELVVRNLRSRSDSLGAAMASMKRAAGRAAGAMDVPRAKVGDIGFDIDDVDLAMSEISARLLKRLDFEDIRNPPDRQLSAACATTSRTS